MNRKHGEYRYAKVANTEKASWFMKEITKHDSDHVKFPNVFRICLIICLQISHHIVQQHLQALNFGKVFRMKSKCKCRNPFRLLITSRMSQQTSFVNYLKA